MACASPGVRRLGAQANGSQIVALAHNPYPPAAPPPPHIPRCWSVDQVELVAASAERVPPSVPRDHLSSSAFRVGGNGGRSRNVCQGQYSRAAESPEVGGLRHRRLWEFAAARRLCPRGARCLRPGCADLPSRRCGSWRCWSCPSSAPVWRLRTGVCEYLPRRSVGSPSRWCALSAPWCADLPSRRCGSWRPLSCASSAGCVVSVPWRCAASSCPEVRVTASQGTCASPAFLGTARRLHCRSASWRCVVSPARRCASPASRGSCASSALSVCVFGRARHRRP